MPPKLNEKFPIQVAVIIDGFIWRLWHSPIIAMGYNYGGGHLILRDICYDYLLYNYSYNSIIFIFVKQNLSGVLCYFTLH